MTESLPLYEGLFLFSLNELGGRLGPAVDQLRQILDRADAQVEALFKWDERKLAYEIKGNKRGLYLLSYFRVTGEKIEQIERNVNLSDTILRCMILRAEHIGDTELEEARKLQAQTADAVAISEESLEAEQKPTAAEAEEPQAETDATDDSSQAASDNATASAESVEAKTSEMS